MKLKHNKNIHRLKSSNIIILIIIFVIIGILILFKFFNQKLKPIFLNIAESESKKIATLIINDSISKQLTSDLTVDNLFNITKDNDGNITSTAFGSNLTLDRKKQRDIQNLHITLSKRWVQPSSRSGA